MVKTVGKYDLYGTLGVGAFGKVKYAVNTETEEAVAIKVLDKDKIQTRNMGNQIKKEIQIMKMIDHKYVVKVKDVFATREKIFIVLEFVGGGELFDKIASEGKFSEEKARFYFTQILEGLEYCHINGICHRDLKPENLLLDTEGNTKISDFGFSTLNIGDADGDGNARAELLHTTCGTPNYVAPEVLGKDGYDGKKADIWSMGVILYVLLAGYLPFDENTMHALFTKIKVADYTFPDWFTASARDMMSKILVTSPNMRAKISDIKSHPWFMNTEFEGSEAASIPAPPKVSSSMNSKSNSSDSTKSGHTNTEEISVSLPPAPPKAHQEVAAEPKRPVSIKEKEKETPKAPPATPPPAAAPEVAAALEKMTVTPSDSVTTEATSDAPSDAVETEAEAEASVVDTKVTSAVDDSKANKKPVDAGGCQCVIM